jgi:uncharacterized Ntn-hydrolase superfamily protein
LALDEARHGRARRSGAGPGAPASDGVGGSGGAKPPGLQRPHAHRVDRTVGALAVIRRAVLALTLVGLIAAGSIHLRAQAGQDEPPGTFSILGYDPATGEVGGAVQSRVFSVGNGVLWAEAGVGAAATQAIVDVSYGPKAIELLKAGMTPGAIIPAILASDPDPGLNGQSWTKEGRQFAVMDARGNYAAHTGPQATPWAGNQGGKFCTAQGNILAGESVVSEMVRAFEGTTGHLSLRLMAALDAGQAAGGDKRGKQSAAMLIVKKDGGVWLHNDVVLRLQVDDNPEPLTELRRLVEMNARRLRAR